MKRTKKQLCDSASFTLSINELSLNQRKFITQEIGRGTGRHKVKKGKGAYTRKNQKLYDDSYGYFFINYL